MGRQVARDFREGMSLLRVGPVTTFVIVANVVTFLMGFFGLAGIREWLVFDPTRIVLQPWAVVTWPLAFKSSVVVLLLTCFFFWQVANMLESGWGSSEFAGFVTVVALLTSGFFFLAALLVNQAVETAGVPLLLSSVFVAWAMLNPEAPVLAMFVIPMRAKWLGYAGLVVTYFSFGPILGFFAVATPLLAWWYAVKGRYKLRLRLWPTGTRITPRAAPSGKPGWGTKLLHPIDTFTRWRRRREFDRLSKNWGLEDFDDDGKGPH